MADKIYSKEYYQDNREEIRESQRLYQKNNKNKIKERKREHYQNNKEEQKLRVKVYTETHQEWKINYDKQYSKEHPEVNLRAKEKQLGILGEFFDMTSRDYRYALQSWSKVVKKRDGYKCVDCGSKENLHAHHVLEKSKYPEFSLLPMNGLTECKECHWNIHYGGSD